MSTGPIPPAVDTSCNTRVRHGKATALVRVQRNSIGATHVTAKLKEKKYGALMTSYYVLFYPLCYSKWYSSSHNATRVSFILSAYSPHTLAATWVAVAVTRPKCTAWLPVRASMASCAILKPFGLTSMASTLIDAPLYVSVQQVPHYRLRVSIDRGQTMGWWMDNLRPPSCTR